MLSAYRQQRTAQRKKYTPASRASRCAAVIRKRRRPMSAFQLSRALKRHRTTVLSWCHEGVREGLLVCVQVGTHGKPALFDVAAKGAPIDE